MRDDEKVCNDRTGFEGRFGVNIRKGRHIACRILERGAWKLIR